TLPISITRHSSKEWEKSQSQLMTLRTLTACSTWETRSPLTTSHQQERSQEIPQPLGTSRKEELRRKISTLMEVEEETMKSWPEAHLPTSDSSTRWLPKQALLHST